MQVCVALRARPPPIALATEELTTRSHVLLDPFGADDGHPGRLPFGFEFEHAIGRGRHARRASVVVRRYADFGEASPGKIIAARETPSA